MFYTHKTHTCTNILGFRAIPTGGYEAGGAQEQEVREKLHVRVEDVVGRLGGGLDALPQRQVALVISNTKLHIQRKKKSNWDSLHVTFYRHT